MKYYLLGLLLVPVILFGQVPAEIEEDIQLHLKLADQYNDIALYGESIAELEEVIKLAKANKLEAYLLDASIQKAEIFRKTENFDRGILLLESIPETEKYPLLHVRKLGRLAALYAENAAIDKKTQTDSILAFTTQGIKLAVEHGFKAEEASLRNELGFRQNREKKFDEALANLKRSSELFKEIGDEENEMGALVNTLDLYVNAVWFDKYDSLYPILAERVEDKDWFATRSNLYRIIAAPFYTLGDTVTAANWMSRAHANTVEHYRKMNSAQMAAFKIIHDTNLYKEDVLLKSRDLERQNNKNKELYFYIIILFLVIALIVLIFFRERKLKQDLNRTVADLNVLNEKYQMLMVESNHRIKNNLQMIISMLEYTKKGAKNMDPRFVQNISTKIQTISALHKHLYLDVHNGLVDLDAFFAEVTAHYEGIGIKYEMNQEIASVSIPGERIVYFGLILNEMLANTLEHGHPEGGDLTITVEPQNSGYLFSYCDHSAHTENKGEGLGIRLIEQLINRVNGKDYNLDKTTGTYQFYFEADK